MLRGEQVVLRALTREDLQRQWEFANDPAFHLLIHDEPWEPLSLARATARFEASLGAAERDGPHFAIEADGKYIGHCLLYQFDHTAHTCMLGIGIGDSAYQGRGYGREALRLLLDYAFRRRNLHKVSLTVSGDNERAIRAYRACGFVEEGCLRQHVWGNGVYLDLVCMGLLRSEWEHARETT
ncbi:MAG TPA: GNAT family protein [Ktedonobacterales bacterium]|nr:GNAT family protein [Ktedonobacterales bacterium]